MAKLCAIMSMHSEDTVSSQSYHLPFHTFDLSDVDVDKGTCSGSLDVFMSYRTRLTSQLESDDVEEHVIFSVSILRICGLKVDSLFLQLHLCCHVKNFFKLSAINPDSVISKHLFSLENSIHFILPFFYWFVAKICDFFRIFFSKWSLVLLCW